MRTLEIQKTCKGKFETAFTVQSDDPNIHLTMDEICMVLNEDSFELSEWRVKPESPASEILTSFMNSIGDQQ
jgi:hypothetical protein